MKDTSFGKLDILLTENESPKIEHLIFEKEGRVHKHPEFESFFVLSGSGIVVKGKEHIRVSPGDLVSIPPKTNHWMIPDDGEKLTGFLWYHDSEINMKNYCSDRSAKE